MLVLDASLRWILFLFCFLICVFFPLLYFFLVLCFFTLCVFAAVVRSINKSGTKSEDSSVQTSHQDPLSCRQRPFTGNFSS